MTGGFESMTKVPYYAPGGRYGMGYGHGALEDGIIRDGLWDVYNDVHMGVCAEKCVSDFSFTREEQDEFAVLSYTRAKEAWDEGR
jgi:acetyl-CoA C-acetyltransferase